MRLNRDALLPLSQCLSRERCRRPIAVSLLCAIGCVLRDEFQDKDDDQLHRNSGPLGCQLGQRSTKQGQIGLTSVHIIGTCCITWGKVGMMEETIRVIAFWILVPTTFGVMYSPGWDEKQRIFGDQHVLIPIVLPSAVWKDYRHPAKEIS